MFVPAAQSFPPTLDFATSAASPSATNPYSSRKLPSRSHHHLSNSLRRPRPASAFITV